MSIGPGFILDSFSKKSTQLETMPNIGIYFIYIISFNGNIWENWMIDRDVVIQIKNPKL